MSLFSLLNLSSAMPKVKAMGRYNFSKRQMIPTFGNGAKPDAIVEKAAKPEAAADVALPIRVAGITATEEAGGLAKAKTPSNAGWFKRTNPFAGSAASASGPAKTAPPSQPELSLDRVKVVRNDLSDADIEVVPKAAKTPKAPPGTTIPEKRYTRPEDRPDRLGKKAWSLLGSRLFGAAARKY